MLTLHFNDTELKVHEDGSSYRYRALMEKPQLVLKFSLPEFKEIPVGAWCEFQGERYTLGSPENIKKNGTRNIEYTLTLGTAQDNLGYYKMRDPVDHRLKFSMTGKPKDFLNAIVRNLNDRDGDSWKVGECIDAAEKTIEFNHAYIDAALQDIANAFETEWEIDNNGTISLHKVGYFKEDPLPLSYGKGNGFVPGVGRATRDDELPIKRLYVQGGERNIDPSKYKSKELLLPKGQTLDYEGRTYQADADGYYIERIDKVSDAVKEDSLDCSEIYPSRVGTVSKVDTEEGKDTDGNPVTFYNIYDDSIPDNLNYNDCRIDGETATIVFQSGMLVGKEFDIQQTDKALTGYKHEERKFELCPQEIDGVMMPGGVYVPKQGDKYAVFGINLPQAYICDNDTKTGASWDMFKEAARKLYENEDPKFTFTGELQGLWAKRNWVNVGGKLKVGGYVLFSDEQFARDGIAIRITGIKDYISSPYTPQLEISNSVSGKSLSSKLREIEKNEVKTEDGIRDAVNYTKRRWRDAKETVGMLQDAWQTNFSHFSGSVNPLTVETMMMLVGDESLQFRFVRSKTDLTPVGDIISYNNETKQLHVPHSFIQHMTLGISNISSSHANNEYKVWEMEEFRSAYLDHPEKKYYLYAKVSSTNTNTKGTFLLSETPVGMTETNGYYHLLVGVLNSEYDGERSFVTLYGFTEVLPGRITTDRIVSGDGESWFDMVKASLKLGSKLEYNTEASGAGNLLLRGGFIQTGSGEITELGAWCGEWDAGRIYQLGDEVWWTAPDGTTSSYRYINRVPSKGHRPDDSNYWQVYAEGVKGEPGVNGQSTFKSIVFKRTNATSVTAPTGGSYTSPVPSGWSDGVPDGEARLWMSTRIFTSDGKSPQTAGWTTPEPATDTADIDFEFSAVATSPGDPTSKPSNWHNTATSSDIWMAVRKSKNGAWGAWEITKIKGEKGVNGQNGKDGNGIASVKVTYAVGSDGINVPVAGWSEVIPATLPGQYLWTRTVTTYTDGTSSTSYSVSRHGSDGKDGKDGTNGKDGKAGPSIVYRGYYDPSETYYGNDRRVDVVYYGDRYYIARQTAGEFSGKIPTNMQYWLEFGDSFDSIATGLLLAERAVVDNLTVRELATADEGERITAAGNSMFMFDKGNKIRLEVTGGKADLGDASDMAVIAFNGNLYGQYNLKLEDYHSELLKGSVGKFTIAGDDMICNIPEILADAQSNWEGEPMNMQYGDCTMSLKKNGSKVDSWKTVVDTTGPDSRFTINGKTVSLSSGTYDIEVSVELVFKTIPKEHTVNVEIMCSFAHPYVTVTSSDTEQLVRIAANGMAIHLGNKLSAIFGTDIDGGKPGIVLQGMKAYGQLVGLRIDGTNGIRVNRGDSKGWVAL